MVIRRSKPLLRDVARVWRRLSPQAQDYVISALVSVTAMVAFVLDPVHGLRGDLVGFLLTLGVTVPLSWRRRWPVPTFLLAVAFIIPSATAGYATVSALYLLFGLASTARHTSRPTTWLVGTVAVVVTIGLVIAADPDGFSAVRLIAAFAVGAAPAVVGDAFRVREQLLNQIRTHAARLDDLRDLEVRRAMAEERVLMARDIHDIVGHHLSAIALHSNAALHLHARDPLAARNSVEQVSEAATAALGETRRMAAALRGGAPEMVPSPTLQDLRGLVERVSASGVPTTLTVVGAPRALPGVVETCGFRIVQEALTNVTKHARPARAELVVTYTDDHVELCVDDDGRDLFKSRRTVGGQGLTGMRERAALVGGRVEAGRKDGGGWRIRARLPLLESAL